MITLRLITFFTFVTASVVSSAKPNLQPEPPEGLKTPTVNALEAHSLDLTKVQPQQNEPKEKVFFYPYLQSGSPRLGLLFDTKDISTANYFFGVTYMLPEIDSPHWEVGIDITSNELGFVHLTRRHIFNERTYIRPFYKYGLAIALNPEFQLASIVDFTSYQIRLSLGLEDLLTPPMSIRVETELSIGAETTYWMINLGYSWGF